MFDKSHIVITHNIKSLAGLWCQFKISSYSLPKGIQFGRKEINEVAERRKHDIKTFLDALFNLPESIAHSDLVYTFFHPILRDQDEASIRQKKLKGK